MKAAAQTALDQEEMFPGWVFSTATSSEIEPAHRQRYAINEPLIALAEPVYRPPADERRLRAQLWAARLRALELPFAELVSQYAVTRNLAVRSPTDDPQLDADWACLWQIPSERSLVTEEEILDWEAAIEPSPAGRSGWIEVSLEFAGRSEPFPEEDPWAE